MTEEIEAHAAPLEKYAQLPESTRVFLEKMTEEDAEILAKGIRTFRNALIAIQVLKWLIGGLIVAFTTAAALGDSWLKIKGWK